MRKLLKALLWIGGTIGVIGLILYLTLFDFWVMPDDDPRHNASVEPTLTGGDVLVLAKGKGGVKFGQLARCPDPDQAGRFVVARVFGMSKDKVVFDNDLVLVNGKRETSPRACDPPVVKMSNPANGIEEELHCHVEESAGTEHPTYRGISNPEGHKEAVVDEGRIYLVSDNRHLHLDSRDYGSVTPDNCQHVVFRLWSKSGFGDTAHRFNALW